MDQARLQDPDRRGRHRMLLPDYRARVRAARLVPGDPRRRHLLLPERPAPERGEPTGLSAVKRISNTQNNRVRYMRGLK